MKRNGFIVRMLLAALLAALLTGCGAKPDAPAPEPEPSPAPAATQQTTPEPSTAPEPSTEPDPESEKAYQEAMLAYAQVLDQNCDLLYNGFRDDVDYSLVSTGVMETVQYMERTELLQAVGYLFDDVSGDGIPELLIGALSGEGSAIAESAEIYAGYTCKDGEPVRFLDGWARSRHLWLGEGRFYNSSSSGAAYSAFGTFRISPDGTELRCEDFYFTEPKDEDYLDVGYYHNATGSWDKDAAEELTLSPNEFWAIADKYESESLVPELTPFADYEYAGYVAQPLECKVRADFFDDVSYKYPLYQYDDAYEYVEGSDYETRVMFLSDEGVVNFKLLALTLRDVDAEGNASFDVDTVFTIPLLRADIPLAVPMNFPGDIPSNGFSYTDTDGSTKTYTIGVSGFDGSLVIAPLD